MKKNHITLIGFLLLFLTFSVFLVSNRVKIKEQTADILKNPTESENCSNISTKKFTDGEYTNKEYLYYICSLSTDSKTLIFYYDHNVNKVVDYKIINTNFENVLAASPLMCIFGYENIDNDIVYEQCLAFISYTSFFGVYNELFFNTPATPITDENTINKLREERLLIYIDGFQNLSK